MNYEKNALFQTYAIRISTVIILIDIEASLTIIIQMSKHNTICTYKL